MKLTIKTLDQKTFYVDFDDSRTVWDLKAHLCHLPEVGVKPELQQLIYAGRVLSNENILKSYSIDERKFLVIMAKKSTTENSAENAPPKESTKTPLTNSGDQPGTSQKTVPVAAQSKGANSASKVATSQIPGSANKNSSVGERKTLETVEQPPTASTNEDLVSDIMSMGYAEVDVRRALMASFNNPDRAIEYLIEGIPEFPETLVQLPEEAMLSESTNGPLGFLRSDPRFNQMRRVIQQRPELLSSVLAKIGETNPALLALIREHQDEFVRMLNDGEDVVESDEEELIEVVLTEQERLAVERLVALGFPREIVVQAFLACEKNEEQTADFLCRHMDDN